MPMRLSANSSDGWRSLRYAAPAPAREVIRANGEALAATDAADAPAGATGVDRIAELRARVEQGQYKVDLRELSVKMIDRHLKRDCPELG